MEKVSEIALEGNASELLPLVYDELKRFAAARIRCERDFRSLTATSLVHDAFLQISVCGSTRVWNDRQHFVAVAAEVMRRLLIDNARRRSSLKRGGNFSRLDIHNLQLARNRTDEEALAIDEMLEKLEKEHPRKATLVKLIFFGGLTKQEAANILGISRASVSKDWAYAQAWLRVEMAQVPDR